MDEGHGLGGQTEGGRRRTRGDLISGGLLATMAAMAAWAWIKLPAGAPIADHWSGGHANGYAGKPVALLTLPVVAVAVAILLRSVLRIDPRGANVERTPLAFDVFRVAPLGVLAVGQAGIVFTALGHHFNIEAALWLVLGAMLVVMGLSMGRLRSNFFIGIRSPWTLCSERSWRLTHRYGGILFAALGLVVVLMVVVAPSAAGPVLLGGIVAVSCLTVVYSYVAWRNDPDRHGPAGATA